MVEKGSKKSAGAQKTATAVKGGVKKFEKKVRTSTRFRKPKTLKLTRTPKYPRKSLPKKVTLDQFQIIKFPLTTEPAMRQMENHNTIVFVVDVRANKPKIKDAVSKMYNITVQKVNTLVRPDGQKKAYVRLTPDIEALNVASKIGII
ncbi:hypothetical protein NDN08_001650 [Rhodosorus marinus]|uniref:Large ribosomal subunit protein uL23 N-terminal domain-containing protein n=2 Tax=Rhodosorus marinus TaxID=101924 RepID=A0AAV8URE4_9RHOD|nr:hypothetical protein NDN08_001650 [Rhodosorus marinus]